MATKTERSAPAKTHTGGHVPAATARAAGPGNWWARMQGKTADVLQADERPGINPDADPNGRLRVVGPLPDEATARRVAGL